MTKWEGEQVIHGWTLKTDKKGFAAKQKAAAEKHTKLPYALEAYHAWIILAERPGEAPFDCVYLVKQNGADMGKISYQHEGSADTMHFDESQREVTCSARTPGWKCTPAAPSPVFPEACTYLDGKSTKDCPPK